MAGAGELAAFLEALPFAAALRGSGTLYALVNAAHILGIGLILGAILPLDLRLLGFPGRAPLAVIAPFLSRVAAWGVVLATAMGVLLISVRASEYFSNPALLVKLALIALALANVMLVHANPGWRAVQRGAPPSAGLRISAALSILCWVGALIAGRMIGFL